MGSNCQLWKTTLVTLDDINSEEKLFKSLSDTKYILRKLEQALNYAAYPLGCFAVPQKADNLTGQKEVLSNSHYDIWDIKISNINKGEPI